MLNLKILVDNHAADNLLAEHGFSLWMKTDDKTILFDTGASGQVMLHNAQKLAIDLADIDILVLSHGHYDHTGGLAALLHLNHKLHVYCHAAAFLPRYSINDGLARPIKMTSEAMTALANLPEERMHWVTKPVMIAKGIGLTGEIPRHTDFETTGGPFYFDQDGKRCDPVKDDLAIWASTSQGVVVCIGCCHAGIVNTLNYLKQITDNAPVRAVIGGLHLFNASEYRLRETVNSLKEFQISEFVPCHCTGDIAASCLAAHCNTQKGFAGKELLL
jgi:7,8-dihydropterin-6-yl-methyl-4-(beta-D-ribofuranosyl)aminobenzene 5'-phosphate synthase